MAVKNNSQKTHFLGRSTHKHTHNVTLPPHTLALGLYTSRDRKAPGSYCTQ